MGRDGLLQRYIKRKEWATIRVDPVTEEVLRGTDGLCLLTKPNEPGELLWRVWDPSKVPGYYKDAEATQKKMLQNVTEVGDWWFRSGDLLRKTSDGYWYFVDRLGDTFRWRSENVSTMVSPAARFLPSKRIKCSDLVIDFLRKGGFQRPKSIPKPQRHQRIWRIRAQTRGKGRLCCD